MVPDCLFGSCRDGKHDDCPGQSGSAGRRGWICTCRCHKLPPCTSCNKRVTDPIAGMHPGCYSMLYGSEGLAAEQARQQSDQGP